MLLGSRCSNASYCRMNYIILLLLSESGWETLYALCWLSGSIKMPYRSNNYPTPLDKQASLARTSFSWLIRCQVISTDGALRLTKTYDNHPTHHIHPSIHPHIAFKTTSPLKILSNKCEQSYRSNGSNQSNRSNQSNQGHQEFPPESVIKKSNQIAFSVWVLKHIRPYVNIFSLGRVGLLFFDLVSLSLFLGPIFISGYGIWIWIWEDGHGSPAVVNQHTHHNHKSHHNVGDIWTKVQNKRFTYQPKYLAERCQF